MSELTKRKQKVWKGLSYLVLILCSIITLTPCLYAFSISFSKPFDIYKAEYSWIWHEFSFESYAAIFDQYNLVRGFFNTLTYIIPPIGVGMFTSALAAYSFSRLNFPGKNVAFFGMLSTIVLPGVITMIPIY